MTLDFFLLKNLILLNFKAELTTPCLSQPSR